MAKTKPGVTINLEDAAQGRKIPPGYGVSAGSRILASPTKRVVYENGVYPGSASARDRDPGTMGLDQNAPLLDSPVPKGAEMPHKGDRSKADEMAHADPHAGLADTFPSRGVMDRE